jgi:uncharacterized protein YprB with RNaseH-like and TPR domain
LYVGSADGGTRRIMKILIFDVECSGVSFKANSGFLLCVGVKELGKPGVNMLVRDNMVPDPLNDKKLCKQVYDVLSKADMLIGHNSKWFDLRYLNSRFLKWGIPPLPNIPHMDTCETGFKKLAIKNSLKEMGKYLHCKASKHDISMDDWVRAYAGDKKALKEIVKHCEADVKLTEQVYLKLRPFGYKSPNRNLIEGGTDKCPLCGARNSLQKRGFNYALVGKAVRYQCKECGGWSHTGYKKGDTDVRP